MFKKLANLVKFRSKNKNNEPLFVVDSAKLHSPHYVMALALLWTADCPELILDWDEDVHPNAIEYVKSIFPVTTDVFENACRLLAITEALNENCPIIKDPSTNKMVWSKRNWYGDVRKIYFYNYREALCVVMSKGSYSPCFEYLWSEKIGQAYDRHYAKLRKVKADPFIGVGQSDVSSMASRKLRSDVATAVLARIITKLNVYADVEPIVVRQI
jgi:hypothetical protein